ncbi:DUF2726 domain-containing protein [Chitinivorax sp. PXF-14]|uniref:DUF2726 domain-containing protein n=1 Tax=Chitinivorax sp. PXF-14 TaxID=3230488 RepID=UPI0034675DAC
MKLLIALLLLIAVAVVITKAMAAKKNRLPEVWPFYAKKVMSGPEQVLYFRLTEALPDHIVLAQVQLSRLLGVRKGHKAMEWNNRINRMSADFVVCRRDASVLCVVELDDASHLKPERQQADAKKDKALQSAGINVVRWNVKTLPDDEAIRNAINPPAMPTTAEGAKAAPSPVLLSE